MYCTTTWDLMLSDICSMGINSGKVLMYRYFISTFCPSVIFPFFLIIFLRKLVLLHPHDFGKLHGQSTFCHLIWQDYVQEGKKNCLKTSKFNLVPKLFPHIKMFVFTTLALFFIFLHILLVYRCLFLSHFLLHFLIMVAVYFSP